MLPLPGAPASSWPMFKGRIRAALDGAEPRVFGAFWLFGLINNVLYVIILSAALDLVGPAVPKGVVLLADVMPGFCMKLVGPYFLTSVPYSLRVIVFCAISAAGMLLVALSPSYAESPDAAIGSKLAGIILASLSSGAGELSFLGLTHYYGPFSLAAWGSGTGAAGLVGAGAYALATNVLKMRVRNALLVSSLLPVIMLISFFAILPLQILFVGQKAAEELDSQAAHLLAQEEEVEEGAREDQRLLASDTDEASRSKVSATARGQQQPWATGLRANLLRARALLLPYMLPLFLVYISEYTINQGVSPTLLFPLESSPFKHFRAFYPAYGALYQAGVFISRSSTPFFRIHNLYLPSLLQVVNLIVLTLHAVFDFLPNVWFVFAIILWEGLLGGLVYVNTFAEILDKVPRQDREFSLGAASVSDSGGICVAGFLGMALEVSLCRYQVRHGRDYCMKL